MDFMEPFCRRSKLRPGESLVFTGKAIEPPTAQDLSPEEVKA
jgi:hypothetical protein